VHLVAVADYEFADFGVSRQAHNLWFTAHHTAGKEVVLPTDCDIAADNHVRFEYRTGTDRGATVDDAIGPNRHVFGQLGILVNYGAWMYLGHVTS
jgi:hypothetical protein